MSALPRKTDHRGLLPAAAYLIAGLVAIPVLEFGLDLLLDQPADGIWNRSTAGWIFIAITAPLFARLFVALDRRNRDAGQLAQAVIQNSRDGILLTAPDGRILAANPAVCQLYGYTERQLIAGGRSLVIDEDDPEVDALLRRRRETGSVQGELWVHHADGHRIRIALSSTLFHHRGCTRSVMIVRDVTERHHTAYYMRLADAALQTRNVGIGVLDSQWRLIWANAGMTEISGFDLQAVTGDLPPFYRHLQANHPALLERIRAAVDREGIWAGDLESRRADDSVYRLRGEIRQIEGPEPYEVRYSVTLSDRTTEREYLEKLRELELSDPITGLPNRSYFERRLGQHLEAIAPVNLAATVFLIELDQLAAVNESLGHRAGDDLLREAAGRIQETLGKDAVVVRNSGGGFFAYTPALRDTRPGPGINAPDDSYAQGGQRAADAIRVAFHQPLALDERRITLTTSIGISRYPGDGREVHDLMRSAEVAAQIARDAGGDTWRCYADGADTSASTFVTLSTALREDLDKGIIDAWYQPIVDATDYQPVAVEALARWNRHDRGWVSPAEFIPVAERGGLIDDLSAHLLQRTCRFLSSTADHGLGHIRAAINLSARQFHEPATADRILSIVRQTGIAPRRLTLEITESVLMQRPAEAAAILARLKREGIRIVLDDFGTGYSSLAYLKDFDVDGIKIDRSFVAGLPHQSRDAAVLGAIMAVARELDLSVVAEGVETSEQADYLRAAGCRHLQGFLFGSAMAGELFLTSYGGPGDP
jgi:diguanylate cyclase (GGDEF)-like protein/PAS domain S-box-containing protein